MMDVAIMERKIQQLAEDCAMWKRLAMERWIMIALMLQERGGEMVIPKRALVERGLYSEYNIVSWTRPEDGATVMRYMPKDKYVHPGPDEGE